jgi:hypothetical protein
MRFDQQRDEFVAEVIRIATEHKASVAIDKKGPAAVLIPALEDAGVHLDLVGFDEFVQACADMRDAVETGQVRHGNYTDLNAAVDAATWRTSSDRRLFGRKTGDIAPLEAVTLARACAARPSVYQEREMVIL